MPQWTPTKGMDSQTKAAQTKKPTEDDGADEAALKATQFLKTGSFDKDEPSTDDFEQNPKATQKPKK